MTVRPRGPLPDWTPTTPRQKAIVADLIARFEQHEREGTLPRGGRGMFYDLRPKGMGNGVIYRKPDSEHPKASFGPMEAHPEIVQEALLLARRAGVIPEAWVADTRAPSPLGPAVYDGAMDYARAIIDRIADGEVMLGNPQAGQAVYLEVVCEAEDLQPRLARIATRYGVLVFSGGGYDGLKGKRACAERAAAREIPTVVLHIGDHDDHGRGIYRAAFEDAVAWMPAYGADPDRLRFERLALTDAQAREHDLLDADGKAEVDGLPVQVLDQILTQAIETRLLPAGRDAFRGSQAIQLGELPEAIREALREHNG